MPVSSAQHSTSLPIIAHSLMPLPNIATRLLLLPIIAHYLMPLPNRSEEDTSELQSPCNLVCRLLLEKIDVLASIYENVQPDDDVHHYLQIRLDGEPPNRRGIGPKLIPPAARPQQTLYQPAQRGRLVY